MKKTIIAAAELSTRFAAEGGKPDPPDHRAGTHLTKASCSTSTA
jgi:hypothetical protein